MAITREEFVDLVWQTARGHGVPYIRQTEVETLLKFVNRKLQEFVQRTRILYDDNVTFTTADTDDGTYDPADLDTFSREILEPEVVLIEGSPLLAANGKPGLWSVKEANDLPYDYRNVAAGQPQMAILFQSGAEYTIRLAPSPDDAYDGIVSGWVQHFDLLGEGVGDATELELPKASVDAAAQFIAGELCIPGSEGVAREAAESLSARGLAMGEKHAVRSMVLLQGPQVRGRRTGHRYCMN